VSAFAGHHRFDRRLAVEGILVAETALHVGVGGAGAGVSGSDLPVARDGRGRPYLPGSSLRGALRARLEALLRGLERGHHVCDPFVAAKEDDEASQGIPDESCSSKVSRARKKRKDEGPELGEEAAFDLAWGESCAICRIFGHGFLASRLRVADLPLLPEPASVGDVYTRDGVGLDRDLRTAARGVLYDFEAVPAERRFRLRLDLENLDDAEEGLILVGLGFFSAGWATVGGKGARGLGRVRIDGLSARRTSADDLFEGREGEALAAADLDALRAAARRVYLEGGGDVQKAL
jgi:CRISPR-associated RAMP protein (TIGR02581 family)